MPLVGTISTSHAVSCPRDGSRWYTCSSGSMFVGCCKHNPCKYGCEADYIGAALLTQDAFTNLPDASCSAGSDFYTCNLGNFNDTYRSNQTYYWGCCKSNACTVDPPGCRKGDLGMASMKYSSQLDNYLKVIDEVPAADFKGQLANEAPIVLPTDPTPPRVGQHDTQILISVCLAFFIVLPILVALWIGYRAFLSRPAKRSSKDERTPLPLSPTDPKDAPATTMVPSISQDMTRMGIPTIYIFCATSVIILGVCGFLSFLWFSDQGNVTWNSIMVHNWATRSVSISALLLRTAVDFQAAVATAMLVALLLESTSGVHPYHLAHFSPMRSGNSGPWSLAHQIWLELWRSNGAYRRYGKWILITIILLTTTIILQFSSTILLSDLKPGPLGGYNHQEEIRSGLSYEKISMRITRDSAWTSNPPFYPAFGEYTEPAPVNPRISDTGPLLRAFLPYATADSRQTVKSYDGKTMVLDARVSCQVPIIQSFNGSDYYSVVTGTVGVNNSATPASDMLQDIIASDFACGIAGVDEYSICQLGQTFPGYMGSLNSSFGNSTSYGTAFLVARGINTTLEHDRASRPQWLDIVFANQTIQGATFSICFAPWDASILNVALTSPAKRTEPLLKWWKSFDPQEVVNQLLPDSARRIKDSMAERPILEMQKPLSLYGDLPPERERPLVQSDASGSSAAAYGSNTPLPENWSIFLTGEPFITLLNNFYRAPARSISADPALAAIFTDTMEASGSVAWAMSSLITVLSMTNYYSQLPAFDRLETVDVSFFSNVLYPRNSLGFILLLWALVAHYIIVATIVVLFVSKTRLTLLGNAWSAFSQMAESTDVKKYVGDAGAKDDSTVLKELRSDKKEGLRARLVKRGDVVEFAVE